MTRSPPSRHDVDERCSRPLVPLMMPPYHRNDETEACDVDRRSAPSDIRWKNNVENHLRKNVAGTPDMMLTILWLTMWRTTVSTQVTQCSVPLGPRRKHSCCHYTDGGFECTRTALLHNRIITAHDTQHYDLAVIILSEPVITNDSACWSSLSMMPSVNTLVGCLNTVWTVLILLTDAKSWMYI